jgi:hypothetical protein
MVRNVIGSLLALLGAAAVAWSPFLRWYAADDGRDFRLRDLFTGSGTGTTAGLLTGMFVPLACAAALALLGVLLRSRSTLALAGLLSLGFTVLWLIRLGGAEGTLRAGSDALGPGVPAALAGSVAVLLGAVVLRGRRRRHHGRHRAGDPRLDEDGPAPWDPVDEDDDVVPGWADGPRHGHHEDAPYQRDDPFDDSVWHRRGPRDAA